MVLNIIQSKQSADEFAGNRIERCLMKSCFIRFEAFPSHSPRLAISDLRLISHHLNIQNQNINIYISYNKKAPQKIAPWNDTLDAFELGNKCIQPVTEDFFEGSEDCLCLNVYVPTNSTTIDPNARLPVMLYIYGGQFNSGTTQHYSPDFLLEENVIVVSKFLV